jgi:hypothetical protein
VSLRQNLPDLLSLLRAFLVQERAGAADANDLRRQYIRPISPPKPPPISLCVSYSWCRACATAGSRTFSWRSRTTGRRASSRSCPSSGTTSCSPTPLRSCSASPSTTVRFTPHAPPSRHWC